ncbi:hypothetical protein [Janibacter limosus]|uniref:hypothetical protein n=1 Tax=Janibacter limosus TaxID=53458 RepID=UPI0035DB4806
MTAMPRGGGGDHGVGGVEVGVGAGLALPPHLGDLRDGIDPRGVEPLGEDGAGAAVVAQGRGDRRGEAGRGHPHDLGAVVRDHLDELRQPVGVDGAAVDQRLTVGRPR